MKSGYDLLVVVGGINGASIARDAAGRGLDVLLVECGDIAQATSSASSKLIHGGLRYLEQYKFRLVREALEEREILLRTAPHIVHPLRFVLPHRAGMRPPWLIGLGLGLYDRLGGRRTLPGSERVDLTDPAWNGGLEIAAKTGFAYTDCTVDNARLVVLAVVDAARRRRPDPGPFDGAQAQRQGLDRHARGLSQNAGRDRRPSRGQRRRAVGRPRARHR